MARPNDILGSQERLFLVSMAESGKRILRVSDAEPFWASRRLARRALGRLERKGWLTRLERGVYLIVPLEAGLEGRWSEDPLAIATQLVPDGAAAYWTALHHWGLTEQIPRTVFVQTSRRRHRPRVSILGVRYRFIVVVEHKLFGITTQTSEGLQVRITDREKTLIDACDRPDLCGGIHHVAEVLQSDDLLEAVDWAKLDAYIERMGSGAVRKRLGYLVETLGVPVADADRRLARWHAGLTQGIALLEAGAGRFGPINTRWRVRVNAEGLETAA